MTNGSIMARWMGWNVVWLVIFAVAGCGGSGANEGEGRPDVTTKIPGIKKNDEVGELNRDPKELQQSFADATLSEPPPNQMRLLGVEKTLTNKSFKALYVKIAGDDDKGDLWNKVKLVSPAGNLIRYTAIIKTTKGTMKMKLLSEYAPNHVRSFICLAKIGYYDGLRFDRSVTQKVGTSTIKYIEGGCPFGDGDENSGNIGYWMKPELTNKVRFGPGIVAASHGREIESAACKFFISLAETPEIDGQFTIFGQITEGLSVAEEIQRQPTHGPQSVMPSKLKSPVVIENIKIESAETGIVVKG